MNVHHCSLFYAYLNVATFLEEGLVTQRIQSAFANINNCCLSIPVFTIQKLQKRFTRQYCKTVRETICNWFEHIVFFLHQTYLRMERSILFLKKHQYIKMCYTEAEPGAKLNILYTFSI